MATKRRKLVEPEATENLEDRPDFRYIVHSTGQIYEVRKIDNELWANWENYKEGVSYVLGAPKPSSFRIKQSDLDKSISFGLFEIL